MKTLGPFATQLVKWLTERESDLGSQTTGGELIKASAPS